MPDPSDLTLGVLFRAREDPNFKRITRRLATIVTGFSQGMDKVDRAAKKAAKSIRDIDKATARASKGLEKTARSGDRFNTQIGRINRGMDRLMRSFQVVATYGISGRLFGGLIDNFKTGVTEIINFDQALFNLKAITTATSGEIAAMRDVIGKTAIRTKFSSTEIAEGMVLLGQAGLTAGESIKAIEAVADLAAGTLSDFRNVSDLVTTSLRAFNIDAGETRRVADIMANAVNKSKLTIDKLRTAFNYVGAGASQAGLSLEQTAHAMMLLANNGMRASTIGTGLRQVLSRLLAPNAKLRVAMEEYGLQIDKASGQADWFETQIGKLATVMFDFDRKTVDMSKAYQLFGLRGAQAAAILVNAYMKLDGTWERMLMNVKEIGAAQRMMETQAEGLGFKVKNLADQLKELAIVMGEAGAGGALGSMVDLLRSGTTAMVEFAKSGLGQFIVNATALVTVLFTLKAVILAVGYAIKVIAGSLGAFFGGPVTLAIVAIALLGAGVVAFMGHQDRLNKKLEQSIAINRGVTASLENYKIQLQAVEEGSEEYEAVIGRLIQAHPELKDKIDMSNKSLADMLTIIEELENKKLDEIYKATAERLGHMADNLQKNIDKWEAMGEGQRKFGNDFMQFLKNTKDGAKDAEAISQAVEGWAMDLFKVRNDSDKLAAGWERIKNTLSGVDSLNKELVTVNKEVSDSVAFIDAAFADLSTETQEWIKSTKNQDYILALIENRLKTLAAISGKVAANFERLSKQRIDVMRELGWREFFESLNALAQFDFMEAWSRTMNAWEKRKKFIEVNLRDNFKTEEEFAKYVFEMKKKFFDKELREYLGKEDKKLDKTKDTLEKIEKWQVETFGAGMDKGFYEARKKYEELQTMIESAVIDEKQRKEYLADLWAGFYAEMQRLVNEGKMPGTLFDQAEIERYMGTLAKAGGVTMPGAGKLPGRSEDDRKTQEEFLEEQKRLVEELKEYRLKAAREAASAAERSYRAQRISAEEYFAALKALVDEGGMEYKEYLDIVERETRSTWQSLKAGWNDYFEEMETNAEYLERLGKELPEELANNFADAWGDFLTGVKDAKEAFQDFARDMLRWIAEITAKRAIMSMLSGIGGGLFGSVGGSTSLAGPGAGVGHYHKGGLFGEASGRGRWPGWGIKLHGGLMPNEFPAILRKDEGVFTKKQMQALGMMVNGGTNINVPVSISGQGKADTLKRYLPGEIEDVVLKTMRKYS